MAARHPVVDRGKTSKGEDMDQLVEPFPPTPVLFIDRF